VNRGPSTAGGIELGPDLDWRDWWWLNGYEYLRPLERRAAITAAGDDADVVLDAAAVARDVERAATLATIQRAIADREAGVRMAGSLSAGRLADPSMRSLLLSLLADENPSVRQSAIAAIGLLGIEENVPLLLRLGEGVTIRDRGRPSSDERDMAFLSLGISARRGTSGRFAPVLRGFLAQASPTELRLFGPSAAASLALAGDPRGLHDLAGIARNPEADAALRARAVWAFRVAQDSTHREVVLECLADREVEVRRAAALALGKLGRGDSDRVVAALRSALESDGDVAVRAFELLSLGEIGGTQAKEELLRRVARGKQLLRPWAAIGVGILARGNADPEVGAALARALAEEKNRDTRAAIALAVGLSRTHAGREGVRRLALEGENTRERVFAALAVALGEDEEGRSTLRQAMREIPNPVVRASNALALAAFRDVDDVPALLEVFESSESSDAFATAALALGWNGRRAALERLRGEIERGSSAERRAAAALSLGLGLAEEKVPSSLAATAGWNYMASLEAAHTAARIWM
jgi:HEAT repeat protein